MPIQTLSYAVSGSVLLVASASLIEAYRIEVSEIEIVSSRVPAAFDGFRILHLSDLHTNKFGLLERKIARILAQTDHDMLAATGDLAVSRRGVQPSCRLMSSAVAPSGRFAVFGNSEHTMPRTPPSQIAEALAKSGIKPLINESVRIERGGDGIVIAGVDDHFTGHADLTKALAGIGPDESTILLSHSPGIIREGVNAGVDLVLSGHTHGGQFKLPYLPAPYLHLQGAPRLQSGLYEGERLSYLIKADAGRTRIYVSRGLGASWVPARLFCRPELPVIALKRG